MHWLDKEYEMNSQDLTTVKQGAQLYANYTATAKLKFVTISYDIQGRNKVKNVIVKGKIEARKVAAEYGAKCWNF